MPIGCGLLSLPKFASSGGQSQALLAGIEQLVDQIPFDPAIPVQQMATKNAENFGSRRRAASIAVFVIAVMAHFSSAVVVEIRNG